MKPIYPETGDLCNGKVAKPKRKKIVKEDRGLDFVIEDFFKYSIRKQIALLETLSQILFFIDRAASRGFGREAQKGDYDRVTSIEHSAQWGFEREGFSMSKGTMEGIRNHMEAVGLFLKNGDGWCLNPKWDKQAKGFRTRITMLTQLNVRGLALLARRVMCALIQQIGFEAVDRDHHWGGLASIVRRITGFSLFSMDEDVQEATPDERSVKRRIEFDKLAAELSNAEGIAGYYEDVLAIMVKRFGVDWADGLPW